MIITNPRTLPFNVVHNATFCCTELYGNGKIGQKNYRIFAQRQDCENYLQEEFWNKIDLQKAEEQLYELILSLYLSGKYQYLYHSWIKILESSSKAPRTLLSNYVDRPEQGSNQGPRGLQSEDVDHHEQGSNQAPRTLHSRHPEQGSNRTAGTMNMNVWNRIQSTPMFAVFFGCFSRHRPVTRNKGSYNKYNRLSTVFLLVSWVIRKKDYLC